MSSSLCGNCFKHATKRCSQCGVKWYCSRECQVAHWKAGHKKMCLTTGMAGNKVDHTATVIKCWRESKINDPVIYVENNKATAVPEDTVPLGFMGQFADLKKDPQPPGKHIIIRWINYYTIRHHEYNQNVATPRLLFIPIGPK